MSKGQVTNKRDRRLNEAKHHKAGTNWTWEKKVECATVYAVYGNASRVEEQCGVSAVTVRGWARQPWWKDLIEDIRDRKLDEMDAKMTANIDKALDNIAKALVTGDEFYDNKTGQFYNKAVSAKDNTMIAAILTDKVQLLRGKPTQRVEKVSTEDRLSKLQEEFEKFSKAKTIEGEVDVLG